MKNILKLLPALLLLALVFVSCKKDENKIYFEGGTAPVLAASSTTAMVLTNANKDNAAIKFSWTNPNYNFTTGISSQDVTYVLQVDTTGANFKNPSLQEVSISKNVDVTLTVKELNTILTKLNMQQDIPHNIEFRIKSTLVNNSVPLFSNVLKIVITPYLDVAVPVPPTGELYITGDGTTSGWTNDPPVNQKATKVSDTEWSIVYTFGGSGTYFKFLSNLKQWQPQYGVVNGTATATGGDIGFNMGGGSDPESIPTPATAGTYKVTLNFKTGKYTIAKQ